jgi:hypothetical protein
MLAAIGEQPVSTIPVSGVSEATLAQTTLQNTNRDIQKKGLHCNTDYKYSISPNGSNNIAVPSNALRIDAYYQYKDFVERAGIIYDREDQTSTFTAAEYFNITWFYPFEELPEHVRSYIMIKAARKFQAQTVGDEALHGFSQQDEYEAKAEFERIELNNKGNSMLYGTGVNHILNRRA